MCRKYCFTDFTEGGDSEMAMEEAHQACAQGAVVVTPCFCIMMNRHGLGSYVETPCSVVERVEIAVGIDGDSPYFLFPVL